MIKWNFILIIIIIIFTYDFTHEYVAQFILGKDLLFKNEM